MAELNSARTTGVSSWLDNACRSLAIAGALILVALAIMTVVSVIGRYFFGKAISGDFEMVEVGCAMAISLFLPWCQLQNGNVIVDFVTMKAPEQLKRILDAVGCLLLSLCGGVLAWRLSLGGYDLFRYNDQTMVLQIPTWIPFSVLVPSFALLCIVGIVTAKRSLTGRLPDHAKH